VLLKGKIIEVYIDSLGDLGDGVAKWNNVIIFVKGMKVGESARVKITGMSPKGFAFAEKVEVNNDD